MYFRSPTGFNGRIEDVVVDENNRGKGICKKLMFNAIEYSRQLGIKQIELTSNPQRIAANKIYCNLNFELIKTNVYRFKPEPPC